jgi:hypothetical protein
LTESTTDFTCAPNTFDSKSDTILAAFSVPLTAGYEDKKKVGFKETPQNKIELFLNG